MALRIEPTDEMKKVLGGSGDFDTKVGRIIEILQRDYNIRPKICDQPYPADHGVLCEGERGHESPHYARFIKDVIWE